MATKGQHQLTHRWTAITDGTADAKRKSRANNQEQESVVLVAGMPSF